MIEDRLQKDNGNEDILNAFEKVLPYIKYFFDEDISVSLTDTEKFLVNLEGETIQTHNTRGDLVAEGGAGKEAIRTGKPIIKEVPEHVYGVPFKSFAVPLKDENNKVVGSVLLARNLEKTKKILDISQTLYASLEEVTATTNELDGQLHDLLSANDDLAKMADAVAQQTKGTNEILSFIQGVSKRTNLLGLNASIEAARAGDAGRGFAVVAGEIGQMANSTSDSVKKADEILKNIDHSVEEIRGKIQGSNQSFAHQLEAMEKISHFLDEINHTAEEMAEFSKNI